MKNKIKKLELTLIEEERQRIFNKKGDEIGMLRIKRYTNKNIEGTFSIEEYRNHEGKILKRSVCNEPKSATEGYKEIKELFGLFVQDFSYGAGCKVDINDPKSFFDKSDMIYLQEHNN